LDNWNPWSIKVYLYLVSHANEKEVVWNEISIERGQLVRSLRTIQERVSYIIQYADAQNREKKPSLATVKRIIDNLKMKQLIDTKMIQHGMIITVNNYNMLVNTPFVKMIQQLDHEVKQDKQTAAEMLRRHTDAPDWLLKEWGIIE
jgi:hypothetical protein